MFFYTTYLFQHVQNNTFLNFIFHTKNISHNKTHVSKMQVFTSFKEFQYINHEGNKWGWKVISAVWVWNPGFPGYCVSTKLKRPSKPVLTDNCTFVNLITMSFKQVLTIYHNFSIHKYSTEYDHQESSLGVIFVRPIDRGQGQVGVTLQLLIYVGVQRIDQDICTFLFVL